MISHFGVSFSIKFFFESCFKRFYNLFFRQTGREGEKEKNIAVWLPLVRPQLGTGLVTQACALTGNQTGDPMVRRPALNPLSYTSQGSIKF